MGELETLIAKEDQGVRKGLGSLAVENQLGQQLRGDGGQQDAVAEVPGSKDEILPVAIPEDRQMVRGIGPESRPGAAKMQVRQARSQSGHAS